MAFGRPTRTCVLLCFALVGAQRSAWSGPYGEALNKCFVKSATAADKTVLVQWMFTLYALHPDVEAWSKVTPEQRSARSKDTALLFQRLLTETCRKEAREAIHHEGLATLGPSISLFVDAAARESLTQAMAAGAGEMAGSLDQKKLEEVFGRSPQ